MRPDGIAYLCLNRLPPLLLRRFNLQSQLLNLLVQGSHFSAAILVVLSSPGHLLQSSSAEVDVEHVLSVDVQHVLFLTFFLPFESVQLVHQLVVLLHQLFNLSLLSLQFGSQFPVHLPVVAQLRLQAALHLHLTALADLYFAL